MEKFVLKPTLKYYFKNGGWLRLGVAAVFLALIVVFGREGIAQWVIPSVVILLLLVVINLYCRRIVIENNHLTYIGWFGKRVSVPLKDINHVVHASKYHEYNFGQAERIFFVNASGAAYFSTVSPYWEGGDFKALLAHLKGRGVKIVHEDDLTDSLFFIKKHPKLTTFVERRPFTLTWIVVGGIVVGYVIWFMIFQLPHY